MTSIPLPTTDDLSVFRQAPLTDAISKFEELMAQNSKAFLLGAGCSKCAGLPLTSELTDKVLQGAKLDQATKDILDGLKACFAGVEDSHIEDYLSELIDLLAIAERRSVRGARNKDVSLNGRTYAAEQLRNATEEIKRGIAVVVNQKVSIGIHRRFIKAIHRPLRPGTNTHIPPADYLVLNYDTLVEDALALEKIAFADGLDGGATGWWNQETFKRDGLAARVLKLHGSINWCELPDDPLPRRVSGNLSIPSEKDRRILIWPASTKYLETQKDPYAQLWELARNILRPAGGSQRVLVACGYRFSDSHVNLEIERALKESKERLTLVAFSYGEQPTGQLKSWYEDASIREQVLIFARRGFFHGSKAEQSTVDLPWWKFENVTRLLEGER